MILQSRIAWDYRKYTRIPRMDFICEEEIKQEANVIWAVKKVIDVAKEYDGIPYAVVSSSKDERIKASIVMIFPDNKRRDDFGRRFLIA